MRERTTIADIQAKKRARTKISMLTAYDKPSAEVCEEAGVDVILVGDSAANVIHGHETTLPITMEDMLLHARAVARARKRCLLVADMPFLSYQTSVADAVLSAGRFLKEGLADAVKLEGGKTVADTVRAIVDAGIPVMGHLGLTPQSVNQLSGYRVQGKDADRATAIVEGARALEEAGAFAIVLECVPHELAALVTAQVSVPTIGIGAGPACDGQVLVFHDLLGLGRGRTPRFVKRYAALMDVAVAAVQRFKADVEAGEFPGPEHGFAMDPEELKKLQALVD